MKSSSVSLEFLFVSRNLHAASQIFENAKEFLENKYEHLNNVKNTKKEIREIYNNINSQTKRLEEYNVKLQNLEKIKETKLQNEEDLFKQREAFSETFRKEYVQMREKVIAKTEKEYEKGLSKATKQIDFYSKNPIGKIANNLSKTVFHKDKMKAAEKTIANIEYDRNFGKSKHSIKDVIASNELQKSLTVKDCADVLYSEEANDLYDNMQQQLDELDRQIKEYNLDMIALNSEIKKVSEQKDQITEKIPGLYESLSMAKEELAQMQDDREHQGISPQIEEGIR